LSVLAISTNKPSAWNCFWKRSLNSRWASSRITSGKDYQPSAGGTIVYLYAGDDLAKPLERAVNLGGKVVLPKTGIGEHGYIALFRDSEGNTVGLHSMN
jgi:predicted enzyme related to lactoylglutathione lyase